MPYTRSERMLNLVKMAKGNENNRVKRKIYCSTSQDITSKLPIKEHKPFDNDNKTNSRNTAEWVMKSNFGNTNTDVFDFVSDDSTDKIKTHFSSQTSQPEITSKVPIVEEHKPVDSNNNPNIRNTEEWVIKSKFEDTTTHAIDFVSDNSTDKLKTHFSTEIIQPEIISSSHEINNAYNDAKNDFTANDSSDEIKLHLSPEISDPEIISPSDDVKFREHNEYNNENNDFVSEDFTKKTDHLSPITVQPLVQPKNISSSNEINFTEHNLHDNVDNFITNNSTDKIKILQNKIISPPTKIKFPEHSLSDNADDFTSNDSTNKIKILQHKIISPSNKINSPEHNNVCNNAHSNCNCTEILESVHSDSVSESIVDDTDKDKDFDINLYQSSEDSNSICESDNSDDSIVIENVKTIQVSFNNSNEVNTQLPSEKILNDKKKKTKFSRCKFCNSDIATKNFMRHLERRHANEYQVRKIFQLPKNSKERRQAFALFRNDTNFDLFIQGEERPNRICYKKDHSTKYVYSPCPYCKGLFLQNYLRRHAKKCYPQKHSINIKKIKTNYVGESQTFTACAMDPTKVISKMNIKNQVFAIMKGDETAFEAKKDLLIAHFGESYLKKHKRERIAYACSNRMRELSRLLICFREIIGTNGKNLQLKDMLCPKYFDNVILAARKISGYDHDKKDFKAPSLAMHLGTSLKLACDELIHLILRESNGYTCQSVTESQQWLKNVEDFKKLIESRWNIELASLANKDLMEKRWEKPLLLPLVSDIQKFRNKTLEMATECQEKILVNNNVQTYKTLVHCSLALLILFNRRRIGDVQYLKVKDYLADKRSNTKDFENALTEAEKLLTKKYKRIINSGKGSRAVVILVPEILQKFIESLLQHRDKFIPADNPYVFAIPGSTIKWGKGDIAIKTLTRKMELEHPETISSNKLRKQIATVMQILSLTKDETKQFANFMGHTEKTHNEFYELPVDIYQTAKVSKILTLMEKGELPVEYKGKRLADIEFNFDSETAHEEHLETPAVYMDGNENELATPSTSRDITKNFSGEDEVVKNLRRKSSEIFEENESEDDEIPKKKQLGNQIKPKRG